MRVHGALRRLLVVAVVLHRDDPGVVGVPAEGSTACVLHQRGGGAEGSTRTAVRGGGDAEPPVAVRDEHDVPIVVPLGVGYAAVGGESLEGGEHVAVVALCAPYCVAERHVEDAAAIRRHQDGGIGDVVVGGDPEPVAEGMSAVGGRNRHVDIVRPLDRGRIGVGASLPVRRNGEGYRDRAVLRRRERNIHVSANRLLALGGRIELRAIPGNPASVVFLAVDDLAS